MAETARFQVELPAVESKNGMRSHAVDWVCLNHLILVVEPHGTRLTDVRLRTDPAQLPPCFVCARPAQTAEEKSAALAQMDQNVARLRQMYPRDPRYQ